MKVIGSKSTVMGVNKRCLHIFPAVTEVHHPQYFFSRSLFYVFLDHTLSLWVFSVHCSATLVLTLNTGCFLSSWKSFVAYCTMRSPSLSQFVCWFFCMVPMPQILNRWQVRIFKCPCEYQWFKYWVRHLSKIIKLFSFACKIFQSLWWYARQWTCVYVGMRWYTVRPCHLRTCFCSLETKLQWLPAVKSSLYVNNYTSVKFLALLAELLV